MGTKIIIPHVTGATYVKAVIINQAGEWWNTDTPEFEAYDVANIAHYGIAATEDGGTGIWQVTFPSAIVAGTYKVLALDTVGASLAVADFPAVAVGHEVWDGTNFVTQTGDAYARIGAAGAGLSGLGGMSSTMKQQIRDAMKAGPTAGSPATGSVDKHLDDIQAKTDTLGTGVVTVSSPVSSTGDVAVHQWDDYFDADNRRLEWSNSDGDWGGGSLLNATIRLRMKHLLTGTSKDLLGSVITSSGTQVVGVEIESTDAGILDKGQVYDYQLRATLPTSGTGHTETLKTGRITVGESLFAAST